MDEHFDLIAIGGGSGGLAVCEKAAQLGKRVAIVETHRMGGTCVNNGCVPKKVMWYAAQIAHAVDDANGFGIPAQRGQTDWQQLIQKRDDYIAGINSYWDNYIQASNITRIQGFAHFVSANKIAVGKQQFSADHIVIATGGQPIIPAIAGAELGITSDDFFQLQAQPQKVAVIGGGYIGVEMAGLLHALGSHVELYLRDELPLKAFDTMLGTTLIEEMRNQGIVVHDYTEVTRLSKEAGEITVHIACDRQNKSFDSVIWAVGRKANTGNLNLSAAGVITLENGNIPVDDFENTNILGIYAIGDITGKAALTPVAIAAGRKLAERLFTDKENSKVDYENIPSVVFSHPPIASVGLSQQQAQQQFANEITVYNSRFTPMRYALSNHPSTTAMKLICTGPEEKVVGVHIIGDGADEMLQGFAVALKMGATKADLDNTIAIHPSSAEELVTMKNPEAIKTNATKTSEAWREAV